MIKLELEYPDYQQYAQNIGMDGNINYVDALKFEQSILGCSSRSRTLAIAINSKFYYLSGYNCDGKLDPDRVKEVLERNNVPKNLYHSYKTKRGFSLDEKARISIVEWIETLDNATPDLAILHDFFVLAQEKAKADSIVSSCINAKKKDLLISTDVKGWNNAPLYIMRNIYTQAVTGRYYAREMNIVSLPKAIRTCFTVPSGYFILSMDLRQIDISVGYDMYLRGFHPQYDEIFDAEPEDKYIAMFKIVSDLANMPLDIEYFEQHRPDIKTNILAGLYQAQLNTLNMTLPNTALNSAIVSYYESNGNYQAQIRKIQALYELGIPFSVTDAFGFDMDIEISKVSKDSEETQNDFNKIARDCISYITQGTSNSIKVAWNVALLNRLREAGASDTDVWTCMDRHDENVFAVSLDAIKYMPIFKEFETIRIANWGLIRFKSNISLHAEAEPLTWANEPEILEEIEGRIKESLKTYTPTEIPKETSYTFRGIPTVHDVYIFSTSIPTALYYEVVGEEFNPSDIFAPEDIKQQECANALAVLGKDVTGNSNFDYYGAIWDKFILRNGNSGKEFKVSGINSLPNVLERYGVQYVRVHTVSGEGFCSLGDCYGIKDNLSPYEVTSRLTSDEH